MYNRSIASGTVHSISAKTRARAVLVCAAALLCGALARQAGATTIAASAVPVSATEQSAFNGTVATFTDDNPAATAADFSVTIAWGDATTSAGVVTGASGSFSVSGQHTYADEGSFPVTVTVSDNAPGTGTATASGTATIAEGDALSGTPVQFSAPVGVVFTGTVATFTDTLVTAVASDFTATINWGDATTAAGVVSGGGGGFQVSGTHTYAASGMYTVAVTLSDDAPGTATAQVASTARVAAGLAVTVVPFTTPEFILWRGTVATFSDSDTTKTVADFTATIDWGDATATAGTVTGGSGAFTVGGQHTYADEGSYTVAVTVARTGATSSSTATATVTESDVLSGTPVTFQASVGVPFTGVVGSFTDTVTTNPASDFAATINWGDGSTGAGTITGGGGAFQVSGTHTYAAGGTFTVVVTLADDAPGTATASVTSTANVPAPIPTVGGAGLVALALVLGVLGLLLLRRL